MVLWAVWFGVGGLAFAVRLLRRPPNGEGLVPAHLLRRIGAALLVGVLGVLVATVLLTAVLVTARDSQLIRLQSTIAQLAGGIQRLYEAGLARVEHAL